MILMKNRILSPIYVFDVEKQLWSRREYGGINYSDGDDVESRIAKIINEASDITVLSTELRHHCTDWPSLYHLSGTRANILRPFAPALTGDILEIGAGCGAITRYLGESGANILALEGSPRRAAIVRSRTRDLENVTVLAEKFDQLECDHQFDLITLIGVLEYANLFTIDENPALAMLQRVQSLLKPEGKLIVAIENQLGLKYFAGAPEDHIGLPMYGIEGRYTHNQPQTFGHAVLARLLEDAGFSGVEFLAPFPDYKLPVSILTTEGIGDKRFDGAALAWQSVKRDPQLPENTNFSLELAWSEIFKNRLAMDMSNSFLVAASPSQGRIIEPGILGYHYSTDRAAEYCKETLFQRSHDTIMVNYYLLGNHQRNEEELDSTIKFTCPEKALYSEGAPLSLELLKIVTRNGWHIEEVGVFIKRYISLLGSIAAQMHLAVDLSHLMDELPGNFFDITPQNIIVGPTGIPAVIDTEWSLEGNIELGWLLFRSLLWGGGTSTSIGINSDEKSFTRHTFIMAALNAAGFQLSNEDFCRFLDLESSVQTQVSGQPSRDFLNSWSEQNLSLRCTGKHIKEDLNLNRLIEQEAQIIALGQSVEEAQKELSKLQEELNKARSDLAQILTSRSWKITRFLRELRRIRHLQQLPQNISTKLKILSNSIQERGVLKTGDRIIVKFKNMLTPITRREELNKLTAGPLTTVSLARFPKPRKNQERKKTTLISMVRNEKTVIETFCSHVLPLFDRVILVDHLSSDGTREYIKQLSEKYPSIEYFCFEEPGYYQSELMTWVTKNLVDNEAPGWVFFLDADEFLPFKSREEFERTLAEFSDFPLITMFWLNLVPLNMESGKIINELFLKPSQPSPHCKIAFQPSLIPLDDYIVAQGNHALLTGQKFCQKLPAEKAFPIYHVPIRTKLQLHEKILQGVESYKCMGSDRAANLGFHWDEINRIIEKNSLTDGLLGGVAARYGEPLSPPYERSLDELRKNGYSEIRMDICFLQPFASFSDTRKDEAQETKIIDISRRAAAFNQSRRLQKIHLDDETHSLRFGID